ncbi:hypothetical protein BDV33DRAFT_185784 [Aspergillus novoparasiticus]|uniref:Uncharacterized protein n=1 Tax=Aspergillus novoparasiticus TaxID=986946 RepID=A0A5N6E868_9EURO|nr:hypothetical protein BDV33DRAFT_185784 [Aspergillus novoparasiticus]
MLTCYCIVTVYQPIRCMTRDLYNGLEAKWKIPWVKILWLLGLSHKLLVTTICSAVHVFAPFRILESSGTSKHLITSIFSFQRNRP